MLTVMVCIAMVVAVSAVVPANANAVQPVDLSEWTAESYPAVYGFPAGVWTVSDNTSVFQSKNGQPTMFYSDFPAFSTIFEGKIKVETTGDNDFIGFALGFRPGDTANTSADYLLVDWKQGNQWFNFGSPSCTPGSTAPAGLAVSRVTGIPTADEFWGHTNFPASTPPPPCPDDGGLDQLAQGKNLGSTGWADNTEYEFKFVFNAASLKVFVDGVLEIDITGSFNDGRIAFYNFSQESVRYSGFTVEPLVQIDIKPGSDPNCFNNDGHGVIPVAILGSADFDATQVDSATVQLEGLEVRAAGKSNKLLAHVEDVNGDGFDDLVVQIEDTDGTFTSGSGTATLTGNLYPEYGGTAIEASDAICVVP